MKQLEDEMRWIANEVREDLNDSSDVLQDSQKAEAVDMDDEEGNNEEAKALEPTLLPVEVKFKEPLVRASTHTLLNTEGTTLPDAPQRILCAKHRPPVWNLMYKVT